MAAAGTDKITDTRNAARPNSARATGTRSSGGTSLACDNLAGWPTASKVHFVTYQIDSDSNPVVGTQLDCTGIVSGNTIGSFTVVDGTDTGNSVNDVVEMLPTAAWGQDLSDALMNQHTRTGAHTGVTTDTLIVTSGTTLPAGDIGTADIADSGVTPAKLLTGTGSTWAWQTWVPAYTNFTLGNGSLTYAKYIQIGKTVHFRIRIVIGSSTSITGSMGFSLPVAAVTGVTDGDALNSKCTYIDTGVASYSGHLEFSSTTVGKYMISTTNATYAGDTNVNGTVPFAFGDTDKLVAAGSYEAN